MSFISDFLDPDAVILMCIMIHFTIILSGYSSLAINDRIHLVDCCWMEILVCGLTWRSSQAGEGVLAFAPDLICNRYSLEIS